MAYNVLLVLEGEVWIWPSPTACACACTYARTTAVGLHCGVQDGGTGSGISESVAVVGIGEVGAR